MTSRYSFYSADTDGRYDLRVVLNRAGVNLFWSEDQKEYIVESRYLSRFSAHAATEDGALQAFGRAIQDPCNWRSVANEFFGIDSFYQDEIVEIPTDAKPMLFWNEVLIPLLILSYGPSPRI